MPSPESSIDAIKTQKASDTENAEFSTDSMAGDSMAGFTQVSLVRTKKKNFSILDFNGSLFFPVLDY